MLHFLRIYKYSRPLLAKKFYYNFFFLKDEQEDVIYVCDDTEISNTESTGAVQQYVPEQNYDEQLEKSHN